jgi:hypothetical protein
MALNGEMERVWMEVVVGHFKAQTMNLRGVKEVKV